MNAHSQKRAYSLFSLSAVLVWGAAPVPVKAQPSPSGQGVAQAEVVKPLRAIPLADLSFGSIAASSDVAGSVSVAPDGGAVSYFNTRKAACSGQTDCTPHRASFEVSGEASRTYRVSLPRSIMASGAKTGARLVVDDLEVRSFNHPAASNGGRLDTAGRDVFFVGGKVTIPARTVTDTFRAQLPITVSYN